jgi:hypothetical protein
MSDYGGLIDNVATHLTGSGARLSRSTLGDGEPPTFEFLGEGRSLHIAERKTGAHVRSRFEIIEAVLLRLNRLGSRYVHRMVYRLIEFGLRATRDLEFLPPDPATIF